MDLNVLKDYIENFPKGEKFNYSLSSPFSWRGSYNEVAFAITHEPSTREELLKTINEAYEETFTGCKGGDYMFGGYTKVHFEEEECSYTDGEYCARWIATIKNAPMYLDIETELVSLLFDKDYK